jgi:hypothetical protein
MATTNIPVAARVINQPTLSSPLNKRFYTEFSQTFNQDTTPAIPLTTGYIVKNYILRYSFTLQTTGGTPLAPVNINQSDILGVGGPEIFPAVNVLINGTTPLRSLSGRALAMLEFFTTKQPPWQSWTITPGGAGNNYNGTAVVEGELIIPWAMADLMSPLDTSLDTRLMTANSLSIKLNIGDATNITGQAAVIVNGSASGIAVELLNDAFFGAANGFRPTFTALISQYSVPNTTGGAQSRAKLQLPSAEPKLNYKAFMVNTQNVFGTQDVDAVSTFAIKSCNTYLFDNIPPGIWTRYRNTLRGDWPLGFIGPQGQVNPYALQVNGGLVPPATNPAPGTGMVNLDGWYYMDFSPDGYITSALNTEKIAALFLEAQTNQAAIMTVYPIEIWAQV